MEKREREALGKNQLAASDKQIDNKIKLLNCHISGVHLKLDV